MTCVDALDKLNDYVDGLLSADETAALEEHLADCAACRAEEETLRGLIAAAAALPKEIEPDRDLWPEIAARIRQSHVVPADFRKPRPARRWLYAVGYAAAAVLLMTLGGVIALMGIDNGADQPLSKVAVADFPPEAAAPASRIVPASFEETREEFALTRKALMAALRERDLAPETLAVIRSNLAVIDAAINEIQAALDTDPGDQRLERMLIATYEKEMDFLRKAALLADVG